MKSASAGNERLNSDDFFLDLGARLAWEPDEKFRLYSQLVGSLGLESGTTRDHLVWESGVRVLFAENLALVGGWRDTRIEVRETDDSDIDFSLEGPFLELELTF